MSLLFNWVESRLGIASLLGELNWAKLGWYLAFSEYLRLFNSTIAHSDNAHDIIFFDFDFGFDSFDFDFKLSI